MFDLQNLIVFLLIGLAAGWLAGLIKTGSSFGLVGNLVIGVLGAVLGGFLLPMVGLAPMGILGAFVTATIGALILLFLLQILRKNKIL